MHRGREVAVRCPRCEADRLVEPAGSVWSLRRGRRHLRCVGCHHPVGDVPTAPIATTDYRRALRGSARAIVGALVVTDEDERTTTAAVALVRSFTARRYDLDQLRADRDRGRHEHRLRGELTLLSRHVGPGTTRPLLHAAERVAHASGPPTPPQLEVLDLVGHHLTTRTGRRAPRGTV